MTVQPKVSKFFALGLGIVVVLSMAGVVVYQKYFDKAVISPELLVPPTISPEFNNNNNPVGVNTTAEVSITTGTDWIGQYEAKGELREYAKFFPVEVDGSVSVDVNWDKLATPVDDKTLKDILFEKQPKMPVDAKIFKVGTISDPIGLKNKILYSVYVKNISDTYESWNLSFLAFLDDVRNKFVVIADATTFGMCSKWSECNNYLDFPYIGGVVDITRFKNIKLTSMINLPHNDSRLVIAGVHYAPSKDRFGSGDRVEAGGILYDENFKIKPLPSPLLFNTEGGEVYFENGCYKLVTQDGAYHNYELLPYFLSSEASQINVAYDADIKWLSGKGPKKLSLTGYDIKNGIGCGQMYNNCTNIVSGQSWFDESQLVKVAITKKGEYLYGLKNKKTNPFYREEFELFANYDPDFSIEYDNTSTDYLAKLKVSEEKMWKKFISEEPLVFWKDSTGNWRAYRDAETFFIAAECGKPVIYLYPKQDMDVNVKVQPNGGLTKVEPAYPLNGWNVRATPQSDLTDLLDGQKYPYLFWEGKAYNMVTPDYGFVLKREEVGERMKEILAKLGLNEKETADFLEFWQPKLEVKPYVFVTFVPQTEFDKLAPLTITPTPDKVIRVFMDYSPLEAPIKAVEPKISTPVRTGFTVVEWGGRLK